VDGTERLPQMPAQGDDEDRKPPCDPVNLPEADIDRGAEEIVEPLAAGAI